MDQTYQTRLEELGDKNLSSIEAHHDLRNYVVKNNSEAEVGKVSDLLYDTKSRKVRYLVIDIRESSETPVPRKILAPIGMVDLYELNNYLVISALNTQLIDILPDYIAGEVNPGVENMVRLAYAGESEDADCGGITGNNVLPEADEDIFYSHFHFDFNRMMKKDSSQRERKTVSAVFDDGLEAENSISELLSNGFDKNSVELSSSKNIEQSEESATSRGSVVSVKISSEKEALRASEIFDKNGSVTVYENS